MTASQRFKPGDRVSIRAKQLRSMVFRLGVVVGFSKRDPAIVRIKRDGRPEPEPFHERYWEVIKP